MQEMIDQVLAFWDQVMTHVSSLQFYAQIGIVLVALALAWTISAYLRTHVRIFREEPEPGALHEVLSALHNGRELLRPVLAAILLGLATPLTAQYVGEAWRSAFRRWRWRGSSPRGSR